MTPEEMFTDHQRLAYWYLYRFLPDKFKDEDYRQIALLGLWKACRSYDNDKKSSFATYAVACIRNEFRTYHKDIHRAKREGDLFLLSIEKPTLGDGKEDRESSISDVLDDPDSLKSYDKVFDREFLEYIYNYPYTTDSQKKLIDLICKGYEPGEIVNELGITRQRVHQLKRELRKKFSEDYSHM